MANKKNKKRKKSLLSKKRTAKENFKKRHTKMDSNKLKYVDVLISEVKKRPVIWDRNFQHDRRKAMVTAWENIASKLNKRPDEVRKKWRGLKDTFHLEEKKIKLPSVKEGKPLISYYNGQWAHFEKLLFLYGTRSRGEEYITSSSENIDTDNSQTCQEDNVIKVECDIFEQTDVFEAVQTENVLKQKANDEPDNKKLEVPNEDKHKLNPQANTPQPVNTGSDQNTNFIHIAVRKRGIDGTSDVNNKIPMLTIEPLPMLPTKPSQIDTCLDEDLLFVKSLLPFFRKLNPIRKLIVKNEMQNLVVKEMLCDHCRSVGPQPNCRCNLN